MKGVPHYDKDGKEQRVVSTGTVTTPVFPMILSGRTV